MLLDDPSSIQKSMKFVLSGEEYKARIKDYKSQLNPLIIDINYERTIYNMAKTELKLRQQNFSKGQIDSLWNSSFYHKVELYRCDEPIETKVDIDDEYYFYCFVF